MALSVRPGRQGLTRRPRGTFTPSPAPPRYQVGITARGFRGTTTTTAAATAVTAAAAVRHGITQLTSIWSPHYPNTRFSLSLFHPKTPPTAEPRCWAMHSITTQSTSIWSPYDPNYRRITQSTSIWSPCYPNSQVVEVSREHPPPPARGPRGRALPAGAWRWWPSGSPASCARRGWCAPVRRAVHAAPRGPVTAVPRAHVTSTTLALRCTAGNLEWREPPVSSTRQYLRRSAEE